MMPRNDEKLKGPSHRNKGACKKQGAYGDGEFVLKYLRSIYRQLTELVPETSRGILRVDRMSEPD
jgi:hypothetical protein